MPLEVEVKRWIQTHLAHTHSYICPVQNYGAFSYMFFTPNSLVFIAAALMPCSVAVHSHGPILPFSWTLLILKTTKETEHFLNWNEQTTRSAHHLTGTKRQLTESIRSWLEWLRQWRIQAALCLPLPSRGCSAMECQEEVQLTPFLWFLRSQWSKFGLKRECRMLFCALIFLNTQRLLWDFLVVFYKHILPFHVSRLQPATLLEDTTWCYILKIEVWAEFSFMLLWTRKPTAEEPQPSSALYMSRDLWTQDTTLHIWTLTISYLKTFFEMSLFLTSGTRKK